MSEQCLREMAPMGLARRVRYLQQRYGVQCTPFRLRNFYLKRHITYRVTSKSWRCTDEEDARLSVERRAYAVRLHELKAQNTPMVYMDECTMSNWMVKSRTWQLKGSQIPVLVSPKRHKGITVSAKKKFSQGLERPALIISGG